MCPPAGGSSRSCVLCRLSPPHGPIGTFKGPGGGKRTVKVKSPEKLEGVKVEDTVQITYVEAFAAKVDKASKK